MRRNLCRIGLAATLVLALVPMAASAENYHYQFRGNSAYASFSSTDSTGCISTWVSVSLYENRFQQPPGPPQQSAALDISIYRYDSCQHLYVFEGWGSAALPAEALDTSGSLQSASVTTSIDVYDWYSGTPTSVAIDLDWTGVGETFHGSSRYQNNYGHSMYMSRSTGSSREAEVTGTILLGGTTNVVTGWSYGFLYNSQGGTVSIWR